MARKKIKLVCTYCSIEFETQDKNAKFCGHSCSAKFNNKSLSDETKAKIKIKIREYWKLHPERQSKGIEHSKLVGKTTRGKYRERCPDSILSLSKRTISKVLKRLSIGCSICGWNESSCDIHHINGKKVEDKHGHWNLTLLCPNCHRKAGNKLIEKSSLISLDKYIGETWKQFYFG